MDVVDASEEDEADDSEDDERGEDAEADDEPEIPAKPPTPVRPPKRPVQVLDASPGKRSDGSDGKSPAKKQRATQPDPPAVNSTKEIQSSNDKSAIAPVQAARPRIPKKPTMPMSQAQAIQAGVQAKKTFATLAGSRSKFKLKQPENDPALAAAAQLHAVLEADLQQNEDSDVEHLRTDVEEELEDGEVPEGTTMHPRPH